MKKMDIATKLEFLMKKHNIKNLSQLSKHTKVPYTTLRSISTESNITLSTAKKLCSFFNVPLDFLIDDDISLDSYNSKLINLAEFDDETIADIKSYIAYKRYLLSLDK